MTTVKTNLSKDSLLPFRLYRFDRFLDQEGNFKVEKGEKKGLIATIKRQRANLVHHNNRQFPVNKAKQIRLASQLSIWGKRKYYSSSSDDENLIRVFLGFKKEPESFFTTDQLLNSFQDQVEKVFTRSFVTTTKVIIKPPQLREGLKYFVHLTNSGKLHIVDLKDLILGL